MECGGTSTATVSHSNANWSCSMAASRNCRHHPQQAPGFVTSPCDCDEVANQTPSKHPGDTQHRTPPSPSYPPVMTAQLQPTTLRAVPSLSSLQRPAHSPSCLFSGTLQDRRKKHAAHGSAGLSESVHKRGTDQSWCACGIKGQGCTGSRPQPPVSLQESRTHRSTRLMTSCCWQHASKSSSTRG
jgi:hypothetical protein